MSNLVGQFGIQDALMLDVCADDPIVGKRPHKGPGVGNPEDRARFDVR